MEKSGTGFIHRLQVVAQISGGIRSLAQAAGVSVSVVRKYLCGSEPTRPVLIAMANAAGVRPGWLLDGTGQITEINSGLVQRARHLIAGEFSNALTLPDYRDEGMVGVAKQFAEEYREDSSRCEWPDWIRLVVPEFSADEVENWRMGKLDYTSKNPQTVVSRLITQSAELIAFIESAIRETYDCPIAALSLEKEAEIILQLSLLHENSNLMEMPPGMLNKFIEIYGFQYDRAAQAASNGV